jgi:hypothetical protein
VTFREVAKGYLDWLEKVSGAKPSTLRDHHSTLAEPGTAYRRGSATINAHVMSALGDRPASQPAPRCDRAAWIGDLVFHAVARYPPNAALPHLTRPSAGGCTQSAPGRGARRLVTAFGCGELSLEVVE